MKTRIIIFVFFLTTITARGQYYSDYIFFDEMNVTASYVLPVKTYHYESKYGFAVGSFFENIITDNISVFSGGSMYIFRVKRDELYDEEFKWKTADFAFEFGPKIYMWPHYIQFSYGIILGEGLESIRSAFTPAIGVRFDRADFSLRYTYSADYSFFEIRFSAYVF